MKFHEWWDDDNVEYCKHCGIARCCARDAYCPDPATRKYRESTHSSEVAQ